MKIADQLELFKYVIVYKNLLRKDTCDTLMKWLKTLPEADNAWDGWEPSKVATSHDKQEITDHRTCHFTMLNAERYPHYEKIQQALSHIFQTYPFEHRSHADTGVQVVRYKKGHKFKEHIDHYSGGPRTLSISILLNNDFMGGTLSFWQGRYVPTAFTDAGDACVFPSNLCFPHQVEPVLDGERYVLIVWFA